MTAPQARRASRRPSVWDAYRMRLYQAQAVYRFFAFALGVGIYFTLDVTRDLSVTPRVIVGLVGLATVARVVAPPFHRIRNETVEMALLAGETALILALVLATGGLDSPFLIYSLSPVLSAALLSGLRVTATLGVFTGTVVVGAHGAAMAGVGKLPGLGTGNHVVFALLYATGVALTALLPFFTNLNLERRQQAFAVEEERRKIQRDLHDDVAQTLAFLSLKVQRAEQGTGALSAADARDIAQGLRRAYLSVRDLLDFPEARQSQSISEALQAVAESWSRATGFPQEFRSEAGSELTLPAGVERHLLQMAREALANAARHARPTRVWLTLELVDQAINLRVRDDGAGIPPGYPRGLGLTGMQERAALIGASLEVRSEPGHGTEVIVHLPLPEKGETP